VTKSATAAHANIVSVNEIFDSDRTDEFYASNSETRISALAEDRNTNYGVVRGELLQDIYDDLYMQRLSQGDEQKWQHRILKHRRVIDVETSEDKIRLLTEHALDHTKEELDFDAVIVAAGYKRNMHEDILNPVRSLTLSGKNFDVRRDYSVDMDSSKVAKSAGIWLQGCNETTHGVSIIFHIFLTSADCHFSSVTLC
jgi:L-ornithine N5-oxygenase